MSGLNLGALAGSKAADDVGGIGDVLPRPVAHAAWAAVSRMAPISADAARRAARSPDRATICSHSRSRAASAGHRVTATHSHQCSTSCRTGSTLYSSRALVMVAADQAWPLGWVNAKDGAAEPA